MKLGRLVAVAVVLTPSVVLADTYAYSFFEPCPAREMRPMAVDEAATTLDPGHLQLEMDLAVHSISGTGGAQTTHTAIMPTRLKVGVLENVEAQLVVSAFERDSSAMSTESGYGSTTGRLKINVQGNDGEETQLALIPYGGNAAGAWFSGLGAVVGLVLPADLGLTVVPQVTYQEQIATAAATITLGHVIVGDLAGTIESVVGGDLIADASLIVQMNAGLSYLVTPDMQLDLGGRRGVMGDVPDMEYFVRVSARR